MKRVANPPDYLVPLINKMSLDKICSFSLIPYNYVFDKIIPRGNQEFTVLVKLLQYYSLSVLKNLNNVSDSSQNITLECEWSN